jgi:hypothetical protein
MIPGSRYPERTYLELDIANPQKSSHSKLSGERKYEI